MKEKMQKYIRDNIEVIIAILFLIFAIASIVIYVAIAVLEGIYSPLAAWTAFISWMVVECFSKKHFFKKIAKKMLKNKKRSSAIFWVALLFLLIGSWKFFSIYLLSIPLGMLYGEYSKLQNPEE